MSQPPIKTYIYSAYGVVSLGKVAVEVTLQLYLFDFYTRILGLDPLLAGLAFGVAIFWDALSDLIVSAGLFAARRRGITYTTTLWVGSLLLAATTVLLFSPIETGSSLYLFLHLLIAYVLVNTGMTLLDLPHSSLSAELSRRANERNKLLASRMGFGIFGLAVGSALPGIYLATVGGDSGHAALVDSRRVSAWVLAAIVLVTGSLTAFFLRERERATAHEAQSSLPKWAEVKRLFADQAFVRILLAGVIAAVGRTINAALALMYYRLVLELSEAQVTQMIFPVFTLSIVLSIPLWIALSKRYGKRMPSYISVGGLGVMGIIAYPILPAGLVWPPLLVSTIGGVLCGAVFLVDSMVTDLIDADELATGKRKESLYFAVWKSGLKVARAIAFVAIGLGLNLMGLDLSRESVSESMQWGIILLFGIVVGLCFVLAACFIYRADVPEPKEI
ncbi:MAG: Na+/melibiose symporter-like transporter [Candidatus Azotimanducaceae bacterium]